MSVLLRFPRAPTVIGDNDPDMTIFQQPWWLEAVSDNRYRAVSISGDDGLIWWPYVQERWWGFSMVGAPPMTHILGPVIRVPDTDAASQAAHRDALIHGALAQFPRFDGFQQILAPDAADALHFHMAGFEVAVRYTFRLDTRAPVEALWAGLKDRARNKVRRARQNFTLAHDLSVMDFYAFYEANLKSLGRVNHHDEGVYRRLAEALSRRDRHRILSCIDKETGKIAAAVLLVWDAGTLYHLRAAHDRAIGKPGASSLLVWEAIQIAAQMGLTFDSDTFYGRAGASFMEAFGVFPARRLVVSRRTSALKMAEAVKRRLAPPAQAAAPADEGGRARQDEGGDWAPAGARPAFGGA